MLEIFRILKDETIAVIIYAWSQKSSKINYLKNDHSDEWMSDHNLVGTWMARILDMWGVIGKVLSKG